MKYCLLQSAFSSEVHKSQNLNANTLQILSKHSVNSTIINNCHSRKKSAFYKYWKYYFFHVRILFILDLSRFPVQYFKDCYIKSHQFPCLLFSRAALILINVFCIRGKYNYISNYKYDYRRREFSCSENKNIVIKQCTSNFLMYWSRSKYFA